VRLDIVVAVIADPQLDALLLGERADRQPEIGIEQPWGGRIFCGHLHPGVEIGAKRRR